MSANIGGFPTGDSRGRTLAFYAIPAAVNRFSNLSKPLRALLYGVAPLDPSVMAGVSVLLLVVALIANYVPARDAHRSDGGAAPRVGGQHLGHTPVKRPVVNH